MSDLYGARNETRAIAYEKTSRKYRTDKLINC